MSLLWHWMSTYVYEADVEMIPNHFVRSIRANEVEIFNIYQKTKARSSLDARTGR